MENSMDKRIISKYIVRTVVGTTVGSVVTRALIANAPKTKKLKVADMTGAVAGYVAQEQLGDYTDTWVDDLWNRIEARKSHQFTH
jgi:RPA family protein